MLAPGDGPVDTFLVPDELSVIIRDQDGQEWRFTELSREDGVHVLRIVSPEGQMPEVEAPSREELRSRLRDVLGDRPDLLTLLR
jgi:hypothetical protein